VISLNNIMPKDDVEVNVRELYEAMIKAVKLRGYDRLVRKQKHVAKRKGKIDHRTGRPGKSK
jgi:hypothetical protein|tara:strand:- start:491 stop:676 length:186 start_codon:yes stop_codon:yes gene_type:complete